MSNVFRNLFRRFLKQKPPQQIFPSSGEVLSDSRQLPEETQVEPLKGNDNMAIMKCSVEQADRFLAARSRTTYERKRIKKEIFAELRRQFGIPRGTKFVIAVESPDNPDYCVLRNKHTRQPLDDGTGTPAPVVSTVAATAEVAAAVAEVAAVKKAAAPKKVAAVKKAAAPKKSAK